MSLDADRALLEQVTIAARVLEHRFIAAGRKGLQNRRATGAMQEAATHLALAMTQLREVERHLATTEGIAPAEPG